MLAKMTAIREEREEGFTLIELLVVILIIGILSAIAIPAFLNQRKSAVDSSVQSDVSNASKQVETWIVKQGATTKALANEGSIADIKVSDGTVLTITGNSAHYTITGTNSGGDEAVAGYNYDNNNGGFTDAPGTPETPSATFTIGSGE